MNLGKGFCACDFMQGKKSFQHFVRKETLQSGLSTAHTKIKNKQIHLMTLNCGLNKGYYFRATCNDHSYKLTYPFKTVSHSWLNTRSTEGCTLVDILWNLPGI